MTSARLDAVELEAALQQRRDPQAQVFWHSSGANDTAQGSQVLTPTTPEGWAAADHAMTAVAEAGNLMMLTGRARDDGDWMKFSKAMKLAATSAVSATLPGVGALIDLFDEGNADENIPPDPTL